MTWCPPRSPDEASHDAGRARGWAIASVSVTVLGLWTASLFSEGVAHVVAIEVAIGLAIVLVKVLAH